MENAILLFLPYLALPKEMSFIMMNSSIKPWGVIVSTLLLFAMAVSLSACSLLIKKESPAPEDAEPTHLVWWVYRSTTVPTALNEILQKANEISAEKIGVTVEMHFKMKKNFPKLWSPAIIMT